MNFLEPLGLLGLAALIPIIALYFLKLKREERVVPSTLLWKKVLDDLQVNAPFQRLKYSLLLLMQLLLVALVAFALARPYLSLPGYTGQKILLLIDTSASMATRDAGPNGTQTRLQVAIAQAQAKIEEMRMNDEMAIIAFDKDVRQMSKWTGDRGMLRVVLNEIKDSGARDLPTHADQAFETALALTENEKQAQVFVLSDGCFGRVQLLKEKPAAAAGNLEDNPKSGNLEDSAVVSTTDLLRLRLSGFRFVSYGKDLTDNAALTQIDARSRPVKVVDADGKRVDSLQTTVSVMVENFAPKEKQVVLKLHALDGGLEPQLHTIALKGRAPKQETLEDVPATGDTADAARTVEAFRLPNGFTGTIIASLETKDNLAVDDSASIVIGSADATNLLLVTKGNFFLEKALHSIKGLTIVHKLPDDFQKEWDQQGIESIAAFDVCIFDECAPTSWQDGGALFLAALPPVAGFVKGEKPLEWPAVVDWDNTHPIMRYVRFGNITVAKAQAWTVQKAAKIAVDGSGGPLIASYETDRLRVIGVSFDIFSSDWAYHRALPLFFRNVVPWLAEASPRKHPTALRTGDPIVVPAGLGATSGVLFRPESSETKREEVTLSAEQSTFLKGTERAGLYFLKELSGSIPTRTYAVNLCSRPESDNAAQGALRVNEVSLASTPSAIQAKREIWRDLILAAAVILMLEWWVFHRRIGL